jgi:hypothetical protein
VRAENRKPNASHVRVHRTFSTRGAQVRAHAACAGPRFDQRRSRGRADGEEEEEEEGGLTSDTPLRSCCKPVAQPPQQVRVSVQSQMPKLLSTHNLTRKCPPPCCSPSKSCSWHSASNSALLITSTSSSTCGPCPTPGS